MSEKELNEDPHAPNTDDSSANTTDNSQHDAAEGATLEQAMTEETEAVSEKLVPEKTEETEDNEDAVNAIIEESAANKNKVQEEAHNENADTEKKAAKEEDAKAIENVEEADEEHEEHDEEEISSSDDADEEEEDETKDYSALSERELISEFKKLLNEKSVQHIKNDIEEIRAEFNAKFNEELEQKKEEFLSDGGNIIDFYYTNPLKKEFDSLFFDYKEKRNNYYKNLKRDLQANLSKRLELIEELKGLLNAEENINTTYKHFKDIQDRWHTAGPIPRDKYNFVWNNYHHHVENFYDFLHLNREFRDLDFKHNLDQKLKLIGRAEELAQMEDVNRAFRELQMLHKMWKEEVGPVAKEYREEVWEKFSAATKTIHDKRHDLLKEQEKEYEVNYDKKKEVVGAIREVHQQTKESHQGWQQSIKKVQELRDAYFALGKVPRALNKGIWNAFKEATRDFNRAKNAFYKNQKKQQYENLEKKRELIKIAEENKESDDFDAVTPLMKKIQADWKKIGHVPRKDSDKVWKQFKAACNHYFDRLHAQKNEANKEEVENFEAKKKTLESLKAIELTGDRKTDLKAIKEKIDEWKKIGKVPYGKRAIERDFNKVLDAHFKQIDLGKKEAELIKFENKLNTLTNREDERKLKNEHFFISKKITEVEDEIRQLENNLGFFQHVDDDNPLVREVHKNIARHKEQLEVWKEKLQKIKSVRNT